MARLHESSGLISLAELRRQDVERSQKSAEEARARAESEQRARIFAAQERAREAEQYAEKERGALRQAEDTRRAELDQLERARAVEVARAGQEARARRELEVCLVEERNARRQGEVLSLARASRARMLNVFSAALCFATWLGTAVLYLGLVRPAAEHSRAALDSAVSAARRARGDAEATHAHEREREASLGARVSSLELALRDARSAADTAPAASQAALGKHGRGTTQAGVIEITPPARPCRDDGDPLDPCLGRRPSSPKRP